MTYLVRTCEIIRFDADFDAQTRQLIEHIGKSYPQIKEMKFLMNIAGPVNQMHWILVFDSLADEEVWADAVMQDQKYSDWFPAAEGKLTPFVDRLYRETQM